MKTPGQIKAEIAELTQKLQGRAVIPASTTCVYEVPAAGNQNANFELTSE